MISMISSLHYRTTVNHTFTDVFREKTSTLFYCCRVFMACDLSTPAAILKKSLTYLKTASFQIFGEDHNLGRVDTDSNERIDVFMA